MREGEDTFSTCTCMDRLLHICILPLCRCPPLPAAPLTIDRQNSSNLAHVTASRCTHHQHPHIMSSHLICTRITRHRSTTCRSIYHCGLQSAQPSDHMGTISQASAQHAPYTDCPPLPLVAALLHTCDVCDSRPSHHSPCGSVARISSVTLMNQHQPNKRCGT